MRLPEGVTAKAGSVQLWPFQREMADAMSDPTIERVTVLKSARVGYTMLLTSAIAGYIANEPAPILLVLPTDDDCRDYVVSDMEPYFAATPVVASALSSEVDETGRNTIRHRRFPGGFLKIVAAKAPRNLRRHTVRVLLIDEEDGMEVTDEGDPVDLAIKRTISFPNRKIIRGSTPVDLETSTISREYEVSDKRVYEIRCIECDQFSEPRWEHIQWDKDRDESGNIVAHHPETARWHCPCCGIGIEERYKVEMVANGRWRATRPDVQGHAGFRLSSLISPHHNAKWGVLAAEYLQIRDDPDRYRTFKNTVLGEPWAEDADAVDLEDVAGRVEPFGLNVKRDDGTTFAFPERVMAVTVGVDVQDDRLEATVYGWDEDNTAFGLGHFVLYGSPEHAETWRDLDELLLTKWDHPLGGKIGVDAAIVDSGDGDWTDEVYAFCWPRLHRNIMPGKGRWGHRPTVEMSKGKVAGGKMKARGRLWIVGVDTIKTALLNRLAHHKETIRFSATLPLVWFEQLTSERRVVKRIQGRPVRKFERIGSKAAEALDCTVYAFAARAAIPHIDFDQRRQRLSGTKIEKRTVADWASRFNG